MNGKKKTINTGLCVTTAVGGDTREEMEWVNDNPLFYLVDSGYIWDVRVIAEHDNFVAINAAAMVDVTGQITSERVGYRILGGAGGQLPFGIGAWLSKGGRVIHVMPSTAKTEEGVISRIVIDFPRGTLITHHRQVAQYIVTEYGIANLKGKTMRQRVDELIAVAHPDFRAELQKEAKKLYWP
jgi:4-hydroxybutyrate CoA-transferase